MRRLDFWIRITLVNLAIVALLGLFLRSKMLFYIPFIDFKNLIHAHSHFAFGGWVTLALQALMIFKFLPEHLYTKKVYGWILGGVAVTAYGMLFSFAVQGYAFFSILFSTLAILVSYVFTAIFIKDMVKVSLPNEVRLLTVSSLIYMILSSAGPFTLAYLTATKSSNVLLYKDAIYTYLHLQYTGFFTLAVIALMIHYLRLEDKHTKWFARLLNVSVLPSLFISYLWHRPTIFLRFIAMGGSLLLILALIAFFILLPHARTGFIKLKPMVKVMVTCAIIAFIAKMLFQSITVLPSLGAMVFANRPIVIGFLHLVLLGFVSLFLLAYYTQTSLLQSGNNATAYYIFITGIILNELVLFGQGLGYMLMKSSMLANWSLLAAAACLFTGAFLIACRHIPPSFSLSKNNKFEHIQSIS